MHASVLPHIPDGDNYSIDEYFPVSCANIFNFSVPSDSVLFLGYVSFLLCKMLVNEKFYSFKKNFFSCVINAVLFFLLTHLMTMVGLSLVFF